MNTENKNVGRIPLDTIEVIGFEEKDGIKMAVLSYQDIKNGVPINNFYETIKVPVNERPLQYSSRGNVLVNQSVKNDFITGTDEA